MHAIAIFSDLYLGDFQHRNQADTGANCRADRAAQGRACNKGRGDRATRCARTFRAHDDVLGHLVVHVDIHAPPMGRRFDHFTGIGRGTQAFASAKGKSAPVINPMLLPNGPRRFKVHMVLHRIHCCRRQQRDTNFLKLGDRVFHKRLAVLVVDMLRRQSKEHGIEVWTVEHGYSLSS